MSEQASRPGSNAAGNVDPEAAEERTFFAYQGSKVPMFVAVIWAVFLIWGVIYLARWVPESWREWFTK